MLWSTCWHADVPAGDGWLGPRELAVQAGLAVVRRREDWRLGRWTAKAVLAAMVEVDPARLEVLAAPDGAPEAWVGRERLDMSVSISHRAGRAMAVAGTGSVGCDLELVEPRSPGFIAEWLSPDERSDVGRLAPSARDAGVNLRWTAKEAAAKVLREGLRLDVRYAITRLDPGDGDGRWRPLVVEWRGVGLVTHGWWREEPGWVMSVAADPPTAAAPCDAASRRSSTAL